MINQEIKVEGMSCQHCVTAITNALKDLKGVDDVRVNLEDKKVNLNYDEALSSPELITKAIEDQGYDVIS